MLEEKEQKKYIKIIDVSVTSRFQMFFGFLHYIAVLVSALFNTSSSNASAGLKQRSHDKLSFSDKRRWHSVSSSFSSCDSSLDC